MWQASVAEIGLEIARYASSLQCSVVETARAGFNSNHAMIDHLIRTRPSFFSLDAPDTRLMCRASAGYARVSNYTYDRRNSLNCSERLDFRRGDVYTSIGFFGSHPGETPPPMPLAPTTMFPMHMNWNIGFLQPAHARLTADGRFPLYTADTVSIMKSPGPGGGIVTENNEMDAPTCSAYVTNDPYAPSSTRSAQLRRYTTTRKGPPETFHITNR